MESVDAFPLILLIVGSQCRGFVTLESGISSMRSVIVVVIALLAGGSCSCRAHRSFELPGVMLWAWQRVEDLRFIDTQTTGVAYLAGTGRILANGFPEFEPRMQPLKIAPGTSLLAVVRIESVARAGREQARLLAQSLRPVVDTPDIRGLQIDFDARASERGFYRWLLAAVEAEAPVPVGVTALASWCNGDRWLDGSGVVEAVPMLFRMGRGEPLHARITAPVCGSSIGLSMDESWPAHRPPGVRRIYLFNPRAWNLESYSRVRERLENWK